ncbi:MAG: hypothetical protein RLZZ401_1941 [Pseudomonadota bacterium]|jgi:hypothetical protein
MTAGPKVAALVWATLLVAELGAPVSQALAQGAGIYACIDARGRKLTSDRPIPECVDREQRELNPSGSVRRTVGPALTSHEQVALEAQQRKARDEIHRQQEDRRREKALLSRYPNQLAHDRVRAASLVQVDEVIKTAQDQLTELRVQRKKLDVELEFFKGNPAKTPASLRRQVEQGDAGIAAQQRYISDQLTEKNRLNAQFDAELIRLRVLWSGGS